MIKIMPLVLDEIAEPTLLNDLPVFGVVIAVAVIAVVVVVAILLIRSALKKKK